MPTSLLPGGVLPPGEPTIDLAQNAAANPPTTLVATPSTKPINPAAVGIIKARQPATEAGFEGLEEVKPETGFEGLQEVKAGGTEPGFEGLKEADKLDTGDSKSLQDDEAFHPGQYLAENPDVTQDPEKFQKLLDVYRARRARGLQVGKVATEAVKAAPGILAKTAKGARDLAERAIELSIQPAVNAVANKLTGDTEEQQAAITAEQGKSQLKAAAEITAGTESAITGLAQLAQQGGRKISHLFGKPVDKLTDSELLNELYVDSQFHQTLQEVASGKGDVAKAAGLDADFLAKNGVELDPSAIENLSLVDPVTLLATAGAFKVVGVGGKILATAATRAGGEAVVNALKTAAAKSIQAAGRGAELAGQGVQRVPLRTASAVGIGGQLAAGNVGGAVVSAVAPSAVKAGGRLLEAAGQTVKGVGEALQPGFTGPVSAGVQRISQIAAGPVGQVAGAAARGAVQGVAAAAPLAAAADESQTAGALLGGGAILGAVHGGVAEAIPAAKRAVAEVVAKNYLDPNKIPFSPVESPGYGVDANLDAQHASAIQSLPPEQVAAVNNFREALRAQGGEIYVQDGANYLQRITDQLKADRGVAELSPEDQQRAQAYADTHAQFDGTIVDANGAPRRVVFLNSDAKGLPHDAGHLFQALLSPERQQALRDSVLSSYTPEQLQKFANGYSQLLGDKTYFSRLGEAAAKQKIADEIIAENFGQIFGNTDLTNLKAPKGLLDSLKQTALDAAETLGIDLTAGRATPDLNVTPSYRLQGVLRNAAREVLNAPEAPKAAPFPIESAKPAAEVVTPEAIKPLGEPTPQATPQVDVSAQRAAVTGIDVATKLSADYSPEIQGTIKTISDSMQAGNPVLEIEHRGITSEPGQPRETGRAARRGEQAKGYEELAKIQAENRENVPASIVDQHQKTFVPVRWVEQGGKPTLIAMSLDKVISNIRRIVTDAAGKKAESLIPYETENGQLTEKGWNDAVADLQTYAENQSNGYRGDGGTLIRPEAEVGVSIPAENPNYTPKPLSPEASDFSNLVQGLAPPETARMIKGQMPGNVKGQIVAEINARKPQPVSVIKPEHISKQEFKGLGRTVKETNPLRNELAARGVKVRNLTEVTERIAAPDIASVKPRTDVNFKAPVTDVIRGGFLPKDQPVSKTVEDVFRMPGTDWSKSFGPGQSLTKSAYELGLNLKTPEDLRLLQDAQQRAAALSKSLMEQFKATGDVALMDEMYPLATKGQFFREAVEAATDTASAAGPSGWRKAFPDAKPPFAEAKPAMTGVVAEKGKGELERLFLPAAETKGEDPITQAAIRTAGGKIFTGAFHGAAYLELADAVGRGEFHEPLPKGFTSLTDLLDAVMSGEKAPGDFIEDGFVTQSGKFLNRAQALDHAEKIGQLRKGLGPLAREGVLESDEFNKNRSFLPASKAGGGKDAAKAEKAWKEKGVESPYFKRWFGDSKVVNEDGEPQVVLHGTTHDFNEFSDKRANVENNLGKGHYFTDNPEDLGANYASGEGPDLNIRVESRAEQIEQESESNDENISYEDALKQAREELVGPHKEGRTIKAYVKMENPVQLGGPKETFFDYELDPDTGDESGSLLKLHKAIIEAGHGFDQVDTVKVWEDISEGLDDGGIRAGDVENVLRSSEGSFYASDELGQLATGEFIRQVFENMGFDGIIDHNAGTKFKHMNGVYSGTTHYIAFRPEQVKSADTNVGTFNPETRDIRFLPEKDKIVEAAIRFPDGKIFSGPFHSDNYQDAVDAGYGKIKKGQYSPEKRGWPVEGFVTASGKFLDRKAAEEHAFQQKQIPRSELKGGLEASSFYEASNFAETTIPEATDENGHAFLPKPGTPEYNSYVADRIEESAAKFPEALPLEVNKDADGNFKAEYKDEPNWVNPPWAFNDTPLAKANRVEGDAVASENKYTDALAKKLEDSYREAKKDPAVQAGETWYSVAREKLQTLLGKDAQMFAELLGATSPNTAVDVNFGYALEAYNLFKRGFYDQLLEKYREGKTKFAAGETEEFSKDTGKTGKKVTERAFLSWWADKNDLNPTTDRQKPDGSYIKFGIHTGGVLRVLDRSWLQTVEGPKTPNFTGNLSGASFEATIDKWAARLVHRLSNEGLTEGKPWRILPPAETGVADRDFFTAQKAFRKAGDALGVSPDALQAILWFKEKQHWDRNGWTTTVGAAKADYNVLLQRTKKNDEGKLLFEKPAKVKKVKASDITAKKTG